MFGFYGQGTKSNALKVKPGGKLPYTNQPDQTTKARKRTKPSSKDQGRRLPSRAVQRSPKTEVLKTKFLKLHEKAQLKINSIENFRISLKTQLTGLDDLLNQKMDKAQKREMSELIDTLCNAQRDLRAGLVNNLRAGYKAIALIDIASQSASPELGKVLALTEKALSDVHDTVNAMIDKPVNNFGIRDLNYLQETIRNLEKQISSPEMQHLQSTFEGNPEILSAINRQINSCQEMIKVFDQAVTVLTNTEIQKPKKHEQSDTIIDILKKQGFDSYIKEAIDNLKNETIDSAKFWGAVSIIAAVAGLVILVTTIVLALTIFSGGTLGVVLIILGSILGTGAVIGGTAGGVVSLGIADDTKTYMEPALKLKKSLNVLQKLSHPKSD